MAENRSISELVRGCFEAYQNKDRNAIEELLSDDFTFTSPYDDSIDRKTYFERCWPYSIELKSFTIEKLFENGNEAFVRYECEQTSGRKFRNTEYFRAENGKIKEVDVYFGRTTKEAPEENQKL